MENEALIPLRLDVDFGLYDELLIYRRGTRTDETPAAPDGEPEPGRVPEPDGAPRLIRFRRVVDRFRNRLGERLLDS